MTPHDEETPRPSPDADMLDAISAQLSRVAERVCDDIEKNRVTSVKLV